MQKFIAQSQLLLAALAMLLPMAPAAKREALAHILESVAGALRFASTAAGAADELAAKIAALRAEVEAMAADAIGPEELETAFDRVRAASAAFRAALAESAPD